MKIPTSSVPLSPVPESRAPIGPLFNPEGKTTSKLARYFVPSSAPHLTSIPRNPAFSSLPPVDDSNILASGTIEGVDYRLVHRPKWCCQSETRFEMSSRMGKQWDYSIRAKSLKTQPDEKTPPRMQRYWTPMRLKDKTHFFVNSSSLAKNLELNATQARECFSNRPDSLSRLAVCIADSSKIGLLALGDFNKTTLVPVSSTDKLGYLPLPLERYYYGIPSVYVDRHELSRRSKISIDELEFLSLKNRLMCRLPEGVDLSDSSKPLIGEVIINPPDENTQKCIAMKVAQTRLIIGSQPSTRVVEKKVALGIGHEQDALVTPGGRNFFLQRKEIGSGAYKKTSMAISIDANDTNNRVAISREYKASPVQEETKWLLDSQGEGVVKSIISTPMVDEAGHAFIVTEYCPTDLFKISDALTNSLKKHPVETIPRVLSYLTDIAIGIERIHRNKGIHRDLKLDNILINEDGKAVIADFGFTMGVDDSRTQKKMGTADYIPPEDFLKETHASQATDLWAFGIIVYELILGKRFPISNKFKGIETLSVLFRSDEWKALNQEERQEFLDGCFPDSVAPGKTLCHQAVRDMILDLPRLLLNVERSERMDAKAMVELLKQIHQYIEKHPLDSEVMMQSELSQSSAEDVRSPRPLQSLSIVPTLPHTRTLYSMMQAPSPNDSYYPSPLGSTPQIPPDDVKVKSKWY